MTEEEKKAKLQELREKAAAKKALKAIQDREEAKANEVQTSLHQAFSEGIHFIREDSNILTPRKSG